MAKFIPFIALLVGYLIVIFLTDSAEGRGILKRKQSDKELKVGDDSGGLRLNGRDETLLSAIIRVTKCGKQGCKSEIQNHKHRHGHGRKKNPDEKKIGKKHGKQTEKKHRKKVKKRNKNEDVKKIKMKDNKMKNENRNKSEDKKRNKVKDEKRNRTKISKKKTSNKRRQRNKKHKSPKAPEDVMQRGEAVGSYFNPPSSLDPEDIMQSGESYAADRYDLASYDQYYAGYGRRRFGRLQRPPEADRLERRLHPNFAAAANRLLSSIDRVTLALKSNIQQMHDTYDFAFNSTRYTMMMGVREELKSIAHSNDMVYDVVMDISLLTKDIYMRAHRRGLTRPHTRPVPEMPKFASFSDELTSAFEELRLSRIQGDQAQHMLDECQRQTSYIEQIKEKLAENKNDRELVDIVRHVNMTVRKLQTEFDTAMVVRKLNRHMFVSGGSTQADLQEATQLVRDAKRALRQAAQNSRGNAIAHEEWHRKRSGDDYSLAPVSFTDIRSRPDLRRSSRHKRATDTISAAEKARLRPIIDSAVRHARGLKNLADRIARMLHPILREANRIVTGGNGQVSYRVQASLLAEKLMADIQNIRIALDRIRIVIYDDEELRLRCEELAEGSGYDDEASPIDCDEFLEEGSGNVTDVITSPDPDEDSDFVFEGERVPVVEHNVKRFGTKLKARIDKLKKTGEATLARSRTSENKSKDMSIRWNKAKANLATADRFVTGSKQFVSDWSREHPNIDKISEKVKSVHEKVDFIYNITQSKTFQAVRKAERKVAEVKGQGSKDTTSNDKGNGGSSNHDFAAAIQASQYQQAR